MKDWKFIKVENKDTPELRSKLRDIEEQIKNWEHAKSISGVDQSKAQKIIDDLRKDREKLKNEIATGNESIDKQEWSMFNGLRKDAEKEIGNETYQHKLYPNKYVIIDGKNYKIITDGKVEKSGELTDAVLYGINQTYKRVPNSKTGNQSAQDRLLDDIEFIKDDYKKSGKKLSFGLLLYELNRYGWDDYELRKLKIPTNIGNEKTGNAKVDWSKVTDKYIDKNGHEVVIQKKEDGYYITNLRNGKEIFSPSRYDAIGIMEKNGSRVENEETKAERKFGKVMGEFKEGALKTPQGKTVTDPAQAKAIAYSEADKVDNLKRARNAMNNKK